MSVALVVMRFIGGQHIPKMSYTDAATVLKSLQQYLEEALGGDFLIEREPSGPDYQLAQTLRELAARRGEDVISRFRLYLVTDAELSVRAKALEPTEINDTPTEFHIWDVQRFYQVHQSSQGREALELDLRDWGMLGPGPQGRGYRR